MSGTSHTQRSMRRLEKNGYLVGVVERWIPNPRIPAGGSRRDLFGLIDIVGLKPGETLAVQSCAYSSVSDHVNKLVASPNLGPVLEAGWRLEVWGWRKVGRFWEARVVPLTDAPTIG